MTREVALPINSAANDTLDVDRMYLRHWHARTQHGRSAAEPSCTDTLRCLDVLQRTYNVAEYDVSALGQLNPLSTRTGDTISRQVCIAVRREWCAVARSVSLMHSVASVRPVERDHSNGAHQAYLSLLARACRDGLLAVDQARALVLGHHGRAPVDVEWSNDRSHAATKTVKSFARHVEASRDATRSDMAALVALFGVIDEIDALSSSTRPLNGSPLSIARSLGDGVETGYGRWGRQSLLGSLRVGRQSKWKDQFFGEFEAYGFVPGVLSTKDPENLRDTPLAGYGSRSVRSSMRRHRVVKDFHEKTKHIEDSQKKLGDADEKLLKASNVEFPPNAFSDYIKGAMSAQPNPIARVYSRFRRWLS